MYKEFRQHAIEWLSEITWSNIDDTEYFNELTDKELARAIERHWDGGLEDFIIVNNWDIIPDNFFDLINVLTK